MLALIGVLLAALLLAPARSEAQVLAYPSGVAGLVLNNCVTAARLLYLSSTGITACSTLSYDGTDVTLASGQIVTPAGSNTAPVLTSSGGGLTKGLYWSNSGQPVLSMTNGAAATTYITLDAYNAQIKLGSVGLYGWTAGGDSTQALDTILVRAAAANLGLGAAAANPPVAQTLSTQGASGTDVAGANFTVDVSQGTGTGAGGSFIVRTAAAGGTGSSQNALAAALTIDSAKTATFVGAVKSTSATGGIGYGTGAGGTVTQLTSKATGVTLSTVTGTVVMNNAALAADTTVSFVLTNTAIAADDHILLNHKKTGTIGAYTFHAEPAAGSVAIYVRNVTAGSLSEAIEIQFVVFKAVTS